MNTYLLIAAIVVPLVILIFWLTFNFLGKSSYAEPAKLKREIRMAHGEPPESREEREADRSAWFGWIPRPSKMNGVTILLLVLGAIVLVLGLIWYVTILAFLGGMVAGSVSSWLVPTLVTLAGVGLVGWLIGYSKMSSGAAIAAAICIVLGFWIWWTGHPLYQSTPEVAVSNPVRVTSGIVTMPPNGDSEHVESGPGEVASFTGSGFLVRIHYMDGHECTLGDPSNPCTAGAMLFEYVHDITGAQNSASFLLHKP